MGIITVIITREVEIKAEELLFLDMPPITISSLFEQNIAQAPNIVSVITEKEITDMGARDMIDVLRTIPGFNFGADVNSLLGTGLRGL